MDINVSKLINQEFYSPFDFSASVAEIGRDAGKLTWQASLEESDEINLLDTDEKKQAYREHISAYGAWDEDEINAWSDIELNALLIQEISGDIREGALDDDTPDDQKSGRLSMESGGEFYFYCGS